jgi:4-diphosphocytidyl-2-C-methyl-D-erythritol kinase
LILPTLTLPSFAKVNLSLRVLGRRADGYHELRTVFQSISLSDTLTFSPLDGDQCELACDAPGVPTDDTNLVARAARLLRERFGVRRGARVELTKCIPAGGGLGGGSSNAAVTLLALARLWEIKATPGELAELGARLGADVPFFLAGGTALGEGRGDRITPLDDAPERHLVVVSPGVRISTAEAYKSLNSPALTSAEAPANLLVSRAAADFARPHCEGLTNDFEPSIYAGHPEIGRARDALLAAGASCALLSGSGSSVFGVFESAEDAALARSAIRAEPGWQLFVCKTLARAEYVAALGDCAPRL